MSDKKGTLPKGIVKKRNKTTGKLEFYARIVRLDGHGKPKQYTRRAEDLSEAKRLRKELIENFEERGEAAIEGGKLTFRDLSAIYQEKRLHPAVYHGAGSNRRKISGVRNPAPYLHYLSVLRDYFGAKFIKNISHSDIEDFKRDRLKVPTKRGERSIADVNRHLELLRAMLRFAERQSWLAKSPFELGSSLISKADEVKRERVLSFEEEARLLAQCEDRRKHLKPLLITAIDTAMRRGELFKLTWEWVDFQSSTITIVATNSKTARERKVGMTKRVREALIGLWESSPKDEGELVFGIKDTVKNSFRSACRDAEIHDLKFHDLRHTGLTRMIQMGAQPMELMKVSGHTQMNTFARYINPDTNAVQKIAENLSSYHEKQNDLSIQVEIQTSNAVN